MRPKVTVIDYGMGNICSVHSALRFLGCQPNISNDPEIVAQAEALILPGVGSFRKAMQTLQQSGLAEAILEAVKTKGRKLLGICLGMQLMGSFGTEDGQTPGLGLIPKPVDRFKPNELNASKIPHIGFNQVISHQNSSLFYRLPQLANFYFVHSYRMLPGNLSGITATCTYGINFLAAYEKDNIYATQFHPEKSQSNGLILLQNFLAQ